MARLFGLWFLVGLLVSGSGLSQSSESETTAPKGGEAGWQPPPQKSYSAAERQAECRKYRNKLISYYGDVFKVTDCERRLVESQDLIQRWVAQGKRIIAVENETIIKVPEGEPLTTATGSRQTYSCRELNGRYVMAGSSEIHFIQNCRRRSFPDWETFKEHRRKHNLQSKPIIELTTSRFQELKEGEPFPTILDDVYQKMDVEEEEVDVIPLSEACRGLNGKYVTYYSRVYKIENCRKREIVDPDVASRKVKGKSVRELTSEQWLSLPDGEPI
jgi:hypothetical protein